MRLTFLLLLIFPSSFIFAQHDMNEWAWKAIHVPPKFHSFQSLQKKLIIAVIDDGFDLSNPLWEGSIAYNKNEIPDNGIDDDKNGKTDDYAGWDFADNDNNANPTPASRDKLAHGTAVLGILWQTLQKIIDQPGNYISILPLKAKSDYSENNYITDGYKAIEYATAQHAEIIVCSWSGGLYDEVKQQILETALKQNIAIIASAGNFVARKEEFPGAFPAVINVTAVDQHLQRVTFANYGSFVDLAAPADSIATYIPGNKEIALKMSGTSAAAPIVAAAVAALKISQPGISTFDVDRLLKQSATPLEPYNDHYKGTLGAGVLNVEKLLALASGKQSLPDIFHQSKSFVSLSGLDMVSIKPDGKYAAINVFATADPGKLNTDVDLPPVEVKWFYSNEIRDTILNGNQLLYPLSMEADSLQISTVTETNRLPDNYYLYYEAITIDSSCLYCSGIKTVNGLSGNISDGSEAESYTGLNDCKWQIEVPAGKKIKVSFTKFNTVAKKDFVHLFNGNATNAPILAMFSGPNIPPVVTSWTNQLLVWFVTDEFSKGEGWTLHFEAVD